MSTPTAGNKPTPRATGGAVFTPSASSPPRSAASPAAHLAASHKAGKSPYKMPHGPHLSQSGAAHTPTPTGHVGSSPSTGPGRGASQGRRSEGGTPALSGLAGLGLYGAGTGQMDDGMGDLGAPQLGNELGGGGLADAAMLDAIASSSGLESAQLFTTRLRAAADVLAARWGRVSQQSLVAVVPRVGLEGMWEDGAGDAETRAGRSRNYIIAGKSFSVEVDWFEGRVRAVVLDLPNARDAAKRSLGRAAEILRKDLVGWEGEGAAGRYVDLGGFATNLQRLARTDQLGSEGASCFEALEGVFAGLQRAWRWEMARHPDLPDDPRLQKGAELAVLCERTGRPTMHSNRTIGLKLDYWLDRRRAFLRTYAAGSATAAAADERWGAGDRLWSLLLEVEPCAAGTYAAVRVSDDWVAADAPGKEAGADAAAGFSNPAADIAWQEPPAAPAAPEPDDDPTDIDATLRRAAQPPAVRFVARFSPPLVVPYATAAQIFDLVGQPLGPESLHNYLALVFPGRDPAAPAPGAVQDEYVLEFTRRVPSFGPAGARTDRAHRYRLAAPAHLAGRILTEVPFAHPRELATTLPFLRQWARVGQLLRRSVGIFDADAPADQGYGAAGQEVPRPASPPSDTDSDSDDDEGVARSGGGAAAECLFDFVLSANQARVDIDCAPLYGEKRAAVRVLPNAEVRVEVEGEDADAAEGGDQDDMETDGQGKDAQMAARVLELSEDLGVVAAWMHEKGGA